GKRRPPRCARKIKRSGSALPPARGNLEQGRRYGLFSLAFPAVERGHRRRVGLSARRRKRDSVAPPHACGARLRNLPRIRRALRRNPRAAAERKTLVAPAARAL